MEIVEKLEVQECPANLRDSLRCRKHSVRRRNVLVTPLPFDQRHLAEGGGRPFVLASQKHLRRAPPRILINGNSGDG